MKENIFYSTPSNSYWLEVQVREERIVLQNFTLYVLYSFIPGLGSGKTSFIKNLILNQKISFTPSKVIYFYPASLPKPPVQWDHEFPDLPIEYDSG